MIDYCQNRNCDISGVDPTTQAQGSWVGESCSNTGKPHAVSRKSFFGNTLSVAFGSSKGSETHLSDVDSAVPPVDNLLTVIDTFIKSLKFCNALSLGDR